MIRGKMEQMLGDLKVGEQGQRIFGDFTLTWLVYIDHIAWDLYLNDNSGVFSPLSGYLKYVGWNRLTTNKYNYKFDEIEIYVHQWPMVKDALDFLYYELGRQSAVGTYEKSFLKPENNP